MPDPTTQAIHVRFVDHPTGAVQASSEVPLAQLPDSFDARSTLKIGDATYRVTRAEPATKAEFAASGRLTLALSKLEPIDPKQLLYSLPTICGAALPLQEPAHAGIEPLRLHEDGWRQCELIASLHLADIDAELAAIAEIATQHAADRGWRAIHVRERIERPLPPGVAWADVAGAFPKAAPLPAITFGGHPEAIVGAVGLRLPDGVAVWGVEQGGDLRVLCVEGIAAASAETIAALQSVAREHQLVLVDWCSRRVHPPEAAALSHAAGPIPGFGG